MNDRSSNGQLAEKDKLGDRNWKTWSWQISNHLQYHGWESYILAPTKAAAAAITSAAAPTPGAEASSVTAPALDPAIDRKALALIKMNVKEQNFPHIMNAKTAREAWAALESVHTAIIEAQQMELSEQLETIKKRSNETVTMYVSRAKGLWLELVSAGSTKAEREAVQATMRGLPESFSVVVRIFRHTAQPESFTFTNLQRQLLSDETVSRQHKQEEVPALFASGSRGRGSYRGRGRHNFQGGRGSTSSRAVSSTRSSSDKECNYCGRPGHIKPECRTKRFDESQGTYRSCMPDSERQANKEKSLAKRNNGGTGSSSKPNVSTPVTLLALAAVTSRPSEVNSPSHWPLDSGATRHMSPFKQLFTNVRPLDAPHIVKFGSGDTATCTHQGDIYMQIDDRPVVLKDVVHTPGLFTNLFSVVQSNEQGSIVTFGMPSNTSFTLDVPNNGTVIHGVRSSDYYGLYGFNASYQSSPVLAAGTAQESPELWHRRMGHLGYDNLSKLPSMVSGINVTSDQIKAAAKSAAVCEPCVMSKQTRLPFPSWLSRVRCMPVCRCDQDQRV
jgi:hypothetical protein